MLYRIEPAASPTVFTNIPEGSQVALWIGLAILGVTLLISLLFPR